MRVKTAKLRIKAAGEQDGTEDGVFEALVATYDLDSYGDKIIPGAFADTLAEWKASGDPIPVIWSHMSSDPNAHIGWVIDAAERDDGLWVKAQLDLDMPQAAQVYRLMKGRRVTQFSFSYDIDEGAWIEPANEQPYYELRKLRLFEVGPCLIGVNQATELLAVKSADGRDVNLAVHGRISPADADRVRVAVEAALGKSRAPDGRKAGRVLSASNETALSDAVAQLSAGVESVKAVLAQVASEADDDAADDDTGEDDSETTDDGGKSAGSSASTPRNEATPPRPATDEARDAGKSARPPGIRPASMRLIADLDALAADIGPL